MLLQMRTLSLLSPNECQTASGSYITYGFCHISEARMYGYKLCIQVENVEPTLHFFLQRSSDLPLPGIFLDSVNLHGHLHNNVSSNSDSLGRSVCSKGSHPLTPCT